MRQPVKSPRAERAVTQMLAEIPFETEEDRKRVLFAVTEPFVAVQQAILDYKAQYADGLKNRDPVMLLASVQLLQDSLCTFLAAGDEQGAKFLEQRDRTIVSRAADIMTRGAYRRETATGNYFADSMVSRSLRDNLRERYEDDVQTREQDAQAAAAMERVAPSPKP